MRAKVYLAAVLVLVVCHSATAQAITGQVLRQRVEAITRLAPEMRTPGSPEGEAVAEYIASVFEQAGLYPFFAGEYIDEFTADPLVGSPRKTYRNVAGIIYGNDLALDGEYIVIGAHYDFIGNKDNISGVAALLEMAYSLKECSPGRNIILVAFDGFELGLLGSRNFVAESTVPPDHIAVMVNLQGIGNVVDANRLLYFSVQNITQASVDPFLGGGQPYAMSIKWSDFKGRSDTEPFTTAGIPTVHVSTYPDSYHKGDGELDYEVMQDVASLVSDAVCALANTPNIAREKRVRGLQRGPLFEGGVSVLAGSSFVRESGEGYRGKTMFSYGAGLYGQLNVSHFGLRPEVQFISSGSRYPDGNIHRRSVAVPVSLVFQSPPSLPVLVHIYAGGYYSYTFKGKYAGDDMDFDSAWYRNSAGIQWGLGIRLNNFGIGVNSRYGLTDLLRNAPGKLTERATYCTLSYKF
ncbi:MAG: M28 family peptidase [Alistipes sp.]|nr:M28 family peptidase [Alistipes sp.]